MTQKRVTFEVAKAIKEAGYPQECDMYYPVPPKYQDIGRKVAQPTYLDVWLWLWREKGYRIREEITKITIYNNSEFGLSAQLDNLTNDPEEAIEAAIKYLVDNDLIR